MQENKSGCFLLNSVQTAQHTNKSGRFADCSCFNACDFDGARVPCLRHAANRGDRFAEVRKCNLIVACIRATIQHTRCIKLVASCSN